MGGLVQPPQVIAPFLCTCVAERLSGETDPLATFRAAYL